MISALPIGICYESQQLPWVFVVTVTIRCLLYSDFLLELCSHAFKLCSHAFDMLEMVLFDFLIQNF